MASVACPECGWSPDADSFAAYCHECGTRTIVESDFSQPEDTRTDKV